MLKSQKNGLSAFGFDKNGRMVDPNVYFKSKTESAKSIPRYQYNESPTKSIYDLVK